MERKDSVENIQAFLYLRVLGNGRLARFHPVTEAVMNKQPQSMPDSPEDEIPGDTMPQTDQDHRAELGDQNNPTDG